jgi:hypothetical protein
LARDSPLSGRGIIARAREPTSEPVWAVTMRRYERAAAYDRLLFISAALVLVYDLLRFSPLSDWIRDYHQDYQQEQAERARQASIDAARHYQMVEDANHEWGFVDDRKRR